MKATKPVRKQLATDKAYQGLSSSIDTLLIYHRRSNFNLQCKAVDKLQEIRMTYFRASQARGEY